jgi:AmiR/NasT family two-component response regulator
MTTALSDPENVVNAYLKGDCDVYLVKPIGKTQLIEELEKLLLVPG